MFSPTSDDGEVEVEDELDELSFSASYEYRTGRAHDTHHALTFCTSRRLIMTWPSHMRSVEFTMKEEAEHRQPKQHSDRRGHICIAEECI